MNAYQILICNKFTTSEDITIFIHRCLQNELRYNILKSIPSFVLLFPEELNNSILDETIDIFNELLLCKIQKTNYYSFIVVSCNKNNSLSRLLGQYKITNLSCDLDKGESLNILNILFNMNDILLNNKPFIQIYKSIKCGSGKSFLIHELAKKINNNLFNKQQCFIRIPFNSPNIDLDFIISRLYNV